MEPNRVTSMEVRKGRREIPYSGGFDEFFGKKLPPEGFVIEETDVLYRIVLADGETPGQDKQVVNIPAVVPGERKAR